MPHHTPLSQNPPFLAFFQHTKTPSYRSIHPCILFHWTQYHTNLWSIPSFLPPRLKPIETIIFQNKVDTISVLHLLSFCPRDAVWPTEIHSFIPVAHDPVHKPCPWVRRGSVLPSTTCVFIASAGVVQQGNAHATGRKSVSVSGLDSICLNTILLSYAVNFAREIGNGLEKSGNCLFIISELAVSAGVDLSTTEKPPIWIRS